MELYESVRVCVRTYVYACMCVCVHICMRVRACVCACVSVWSCTYVHMYMCVCTCASMYPPCVFARRHLQGRLFLRGSVEILRVECVPCAGQTEL